MIYVPTPEAGFISASSGARSRADGAIQIFRPPGSSGGLRHEGRYHGLVRQPNEDLWWARSALDSQATFTFDGQ